MTDKIDTNQTVGVPDVAAMIAKQDELAACLEIVRAALITAQTEITGLRAERNALIQALIWCSGSNDFNEGGIARDGWVKICEPLLSSMPDNIALAHPEPDVAALITERDALRAALDRLLKATPKVWSTIMIPSHDLPAAIAQAHAVLKGGA